MEIGIRYFKEFQKEIPSTSKIGFIRKDYFKICINGMMKKMLDYWFTPYMGFLYYNLSRKQSVLSKNVKKD
jgi:hypothetical protein